METNMNTMKNAKMHMNESIGCTVHECKYHAQQADYCTLDKIMVVKHEGKADTERCTDCGSFKAKENFQ